MAFPAAQQSFRGFEQYAADTGSSKDLDDPNSPLDVRISNNIQKISKNVSELKDMVENIGTQFDSRELRNKLKTKQEDTNKLTKITADCLTQFSNSSPQDTKKQREWKVQQSRFKDMFHEILKDYHELQKVIRARQRTSLRESLVTSGIHSVNIDEGGNLVNDAGEQLQMDSIKEETDLELIKQREEELKQLERDIVDINSIFKDVAMMVAEQGEQLDQVEDNVKVAVENVEEGVKDLEMAVEYTSSFRRKTIIIAAVVTVVIVVVLIIVLAVTL